MKSLLTDRVMTVARLQQRLRLALWLAMCWVATALAVWGGALLASGVGLAPWLGVAAASVAGLAAAVRAAVLHRRCGRDLRQAALRIERRYPELETRLLTAVERQSASNREPGFCEKRLVEEVLAHSRANDWAVVVPKRRVWLAQAVNLAALLLAVMAAWKAGAPAHRVRLPLIGQTRVEVTPGDVSLERGENLVVIVRCEGAVPGAMDLVFGGVQTPVGRLPLTRGLADPVFGGTVSGVEHDLNYHVEFAGGRTRDYRVTVFEHPRLERADAEIEYPQYTGLPRKRIENAQNLSAVQGSRLNLNLQFNKQVRSARLLPVKHNGEAISLRLATNLPAASLDDMLLDTSRKYRLELRDAEGRTNKNPVEFMVTVLTNRSPELKFVWPRGDVRPSPLEEINFSAVTSDDFGVVSYGLGYTLAGGETKVIELGRGVPARERRQFQYLLALEDLHVVPDQLLSWFIWADDAGHDGRLRRSTSDLFFAEVRPFDEIFREAQGGSDQSNSEQSEPGDQDSGDRPGQLAEVQKQILTATWRLRRESETASRLSPSYRTNVSVLHESQSQVLDQAESALEEAQEPLSASLWQSAVTNMEAAVRSLAAAGEQSTSLSDAIAPEQSAYQALLRLGQREFDVARRQNRRGTQQQSSRQQAMQRQLNQLDLSLTENQYETERRAQAPITQERREQLQVLNRLRELARRQQDVNDRLRELQTALQEARDATTRNELRRQLKRLQEEERQMLADVDELQQRLDQAEPLSASGERQSQLQQVRRDVERAADAASRGSVLQALAAGTRAQQQMQEMRDALRRDSAGELGDELRQMRADARELTRDQAEIERRLTDVTTNRTRTLSEPPQTQQLISDLTQQKQRLTNLVERATRISGETENVEPAVSKELYDALRNFAQSDADTIKQTQEELIKRGMMTRALYNRLRTAAENDGARALETTAEMLRQGYLTQAQQAEQRARAAMDGLVRGVERAAERVLGDDAEALRLAQRELESLTGQLERELAGATTGATNTTQPGDRPASDTSARRGRPQADSQSARRGEMENLTRLFSDAAQSSTGTAGRATDAPITGPGFGPWSDRLREVEEIVELPWLRDDLARVRERARQIRLEFRRDLKKPDWAMVRLEVLKPLVEVRQQITEELARREPADRLVPIDRDPVPTRYAEAVRIYYEELGK